MTDSKWANVEALVRKPTTSIAPQEHANSPVAPIQDQIEQIRSQNLGIIGDFKRKKLDRTAALAKLSEMHGAQMEVAKHALRRAVDVEKSRIDTVANKFIYQLNEEYLKDMRELGLRNFDTRMQTLLQLNQTLSGLLDQAQSQDVPPSVREMTVQKIFAKYEQFFNRIMDEEVKLS